ncbi:MAG: TIGR02587 family membrane protein [Thainema sp.]
MTKRIIFPRRQEWQFELKDLIRGMSGGFLFGIPLLYTMEAWWIGSSVEPPRMLLSLGIAFVIAFLLNRTDGFRQVRPDNSFYAATDSLEAIAIGTLCTGLILFLLREITLETSLQESLGKIVIEAIPFAIGVALARSILEEGTDDADESDEPDDTEESDSDDGFPIALNSTLSDIGATLVGGVIIGFSIAPTDEIPLLEVAITPPWLLALVVASLAISYAIVFVAGFTAQTKRQQQRGLFQSPLSETVVSYLVSLITAMLMLLFFKNLGPSDPWTLWLKDSVILGLPTAIGGAAGRLAI